jgi:hypothetical protein
MIGMKKSMLFLEKILTLCIPNIYSLGIAKIINFEPGTYVLDVGTGGGFGIPLAILFLKRVFI